MKLKEIIDGVNDGSIKMEFLGHNSLTIKERDSYFKSELKDFYDSVLESDEYMKDYYKKENFPTELILSKKDIKIGERISSLSTKDIYCWDCNENLVPILIDEKTLGFIGKGSYYRYRTKNETKLGEIMILTKEEILNNFKCELSMCNIKDKLEAQIKVPSGNLIFANFFRTELLYEFKEDKFSPENSINAISGRFKLMKELASRNVGYGQMGNMSVDVFLKDDGKEIIISNDYIYNYDKETEEESEEVNEYEGFTNLGNISLDVWRWQCADLKVLESYNEDITKLNDVVKCKVVPGTWTIEHYYDINSDREDNIYSRLYLDDKRKEKIDNILDKK